MIVRTWHGCVPLQHAEGFARHLERTGVEHAQSIAGNRGGALVRQENQGEWAHFFLATYWQDLAGGQSLRWRRLMTSPVTYPDDDAFELLSDPYVFQHEVEAVSPL
ncbi:antibiotic biosynthesis monooxygenase [Klebsiella pneumoniae]|uniref:Antibiotic biosynthesis monooxygenase n=1 Tax=Klebsiella pneumoniae TaxID=573 RepID=A0A2X1S9K9_KLEPN|nr:antibiotic biosynthesis monooxygenase [Klebsiella pneumoniae]